MKLPSKTVERLSKYRRVLQKYRELHEYYIFSHDLAAMIRINPVHVRRDLMLIGFKGNFRNGYLVTDLIECIEKVLPPPQTLQTTIIGMGLEGEALLNIIHSNQNSPYQIKVTFDTEPENINKLHLGIPCYDLSKAPSIIQDYNINTAILTINDFQLQEIADSLIPMGIKGFINFSSRIIKAPVSIYLRDLDLLTSLDEMAYQIDPFQF